MGRIRYVLFGAVGIVVAAVLLSLLSWLIGPHFEAGTDYIEGWIIRATCEQYELAGTTKSDRGEPVVAIVEAVFDGQRLRTISDANGAFRLASGKRTCKPLPTVAVSATPTAANYEPQDAVLDFKKGRVDFVHRFLVR